MSVSVNKRLITTAVETTYGVDPGGGVLIPYRKTPSTKPEFDVVNREYIVPSSSPQGSTITGARNTFSGEIDLWTRGVDEDGNIIVPEWDSLMQATGHLRKEGLVVSVGNTTGSFTIGEALLKGVTPVGLIYSINTGVLFLIKDTNAPLLEEDDQLTGAVSGATTVFVTSSPAIAWHPTTDIKLHKSITLRDNIDTELNVITGARGNMKLSFKVKEAVRLSVELLGIYNDPTTQEIIYPDYDDIEPIKCNPAQMAIGDLDIDLVAIETFDIDMGISKNPQSCLSSTYGMKRALLEERKPTLSIDPTSTKLADWNPRQIFMQHQLQRILIQVGPALPGRRIRVEVPAAQFEDVDKSGERNKQQTSVIKCTPTGRGKSLWDREILYWVY